MASQKGDMDTQKSLIQSDPAVMMGKPVVAGTRITVELILEKLSYGETIEQILDSHPRLTDEGIRAALAFAARALRDLRLTLGGHEETLARLKARFAAVPGDVSLVDELIAERRAEARTESER